MKWGNETMHSAWVESNCTKSTSEYLITIGAAVPRDTAELNQNREWQVINEQQV